MPKYNKHMLEEPVATTVISHRFSHVVWSSIFAGVAVIMVTQLALALLGSSIGFTTLNLTQGNNLKTLGIGEAIWWIITGCISFYVGGVVSGRMAGIPRAIDGMWHGFITWSVTTICMFLFLTTTLGAVIAGGFGLLNAGAKTVSGMAPQIADTVKSVIPQEQLNSMDNTRKQVRQVLQQIQDPAKQEELRNDLMALKNTNNPEIQKAQIVNILTQSANMSPVDARNTVDRWVTNIQVIKQDLQAASQKAEESTESASHAAGKMAFASFVMLVLGAIFASLGGARGAPHWADQEIS